METRAALICTGDTGNAAGDAVVVPRPMPLSPRASMTMTVSQPANSKKSPICIAISLSGYCFLTCAQAVTVDLEYSQARGPRLRKLLKARLGPGVWLHVGCCQARVHRAWLATIPACSGSTDVDDYGLFTTEYSALHPAYI